MIPYLIQLPFEHAPKPWCFLVLCSAVALPLSLDHQSTTCSVGLSKDPSCSHCLRHLGMEVEGQGHGLHHTVMSVWCNGWALRTAAVAEAREGAVWQEMVGLAVAHLSAALWDAPPGAAFQKPTSTPSPESEPPPAQSTQPTGLLVLPCCLWIADATGAHLMFISSFCICFCLQDCCRLAGYGDELASSFHCGIQVLSTCTEISSVLLPNNKHSGNEERKG